VTDPSPVAQTYARLAEVLASSPHAWDVPSLCEAWLVRHVVAHVTMPVRLTPEDFGREMASAAGDFTLLANNVAARDAVLPVDELLRELRAPALHAWEPPGGGATGALSHAVIHSLDVTIPLGADPAAPPAALTDVLQQLGGSNGATFGLDLTGRRLEAVDSGWSWGSDGDLVRADSGALVALLSGRTLPDGRSLRQP
jgi:uncharacterized protein (TIGR03083 family)